MFPHSPQSRMASQRSCGAFLLKGASRASSCKTLSAKKHQRAVGPGCHSMLCKGPSGEEPGNAQGLRPEHNPYPSGGHIPNSQQVTTSRPTQQREGGFTLYTIRQPISLQAISDQRIKVWSLYRLNFNLTVEWVGKTRSAVFILDRPNSSTGISIRIANGRCQIDTDG